MSMAMALEDLALGEVTLEEGAHTVSTALSKLDEDLACDLYEALRSWVWKALEARRRDDELSGWMDVLSRASSRIGRHSKELATKLEGFIELIHTSVMTAGAAEQRDPLERKHVKEALRVIYENNGRIRRKHLLDALALKAPNLSRVMTPLRDDGLLVREVEGREVFYQLTAKGTDAALSLMAHDVVAPQTIESPEIGEGLFPNIVVIRGWGKSSQSAALNDPKQAAKTAIAMFGGAEPDDEYRSFDISLLAARGSRTEVTPCL